MKPKPIHPDIAKFGYSLLYSPSNDIWYAAYDTEKGSAWYKWTGEEFEFLMDTHALPTDLKLQR